MLTYQDALAAAYESILDGAARGLSHRTAQDARLDGRVVTVDGRRLLHFGSCSYLGIETHPELKAAVIEAVERYGTQFSSSRAYLSAPGYPEAERVLSTLFGRPTLLTPTTTLGHLAALPTLIGPNDALLLDHQAHHSVQTAARLTPAGTVELLPHNRVDRLERRLGELAGGHHRIWYAADGVYSMHGDLAPIEALDALCQRYPQLWLYLDDAHGFSWTGRRGRGYALEHLGPAARARSVVAGSMVKSFGAAGGAVTFPDQEMLTRVRTLGGPMIFSGQVQPPMLGAVIASARLHLSAQVPVRQRRLLSLIRLFNRLAAERELPLVSRDETPIRFIGTGRTEVMYHLCQRLREAGFFVDIATYPAVPANRAGIRLTLTHHLTEADIAAVVDAVATALPLALRDGGGSMTGLRRAFAAKLARSG